MCDCKFTVDVMINYILWMTRQYRVKENEGSRTPPLYSLPCMVHRLSVSWQSLCVAIDGVVLAETRCSSCLVLVFTSCAPLSTCLLPLVLFVLLVLPLAGFDPFSSCTLEKFTSPRCSALLASTLPMRAVHFKVCGLKSTTSMAPILCAWAGAFLVCKVRSLPELYSREDH